MGCFWRLINGYVGAVVGTLVGLDLISCSFLEIGDFTPEPDFAIMSATCASNPKQRPQQRFWLLRSPLKLLS